jgi:hypothetical protein
MMNNKFNCLWFLPFSEFENDINTEIALINGFDTFGHSNTVIRCGGYLNNYCTPMDGNRLKEESSNLAKAIICKSCRQKGNLANKIINGDFIDQTNFISMEERLSIENIINEVDFRNWKDFKFNNIPIGRYASYEVILNNKISPNELIEDKFLKKYKVSLKNSLLCAVSFEKIIELDRFDVLFVRNSLYSINRVACWIANNRKIKVYSFQNVVMLKDGSKRLALNKWDHLSSKLSSSTIFSSILSEQNHNLFKDDKINRFIIDSKKDNSLFTYSEPVKNLDANVIRQKLRIKNLNKNILVTLSSGDESSAAEAIEAIPERDQTAIFSDQMAWLEFLIHIATDYPKINFIFRVHPREVPNKRDNIESTYYPRLLKFFSKVPNNVYINYPKDKISLYDIFSITDLNINFGSSTGLDAMSLGIPSISQDERFNLGPAGLGYVALEKKDYSKLINSLINSKIDSRVQTNASKWIDFCKNQGTIIVSAGISNRKVNILSIKIKNYIFKRRKVVILLNLISKIIIISRNSIKSQFIVEKEFYDQEKQLMQIFKMINENHTHFIKSQV